jgi:hypothetical protein
VVNSKNMCIHTWGSIVVHVQFTGQYRGGFQQQVISKVVYHVLGMELTPLRVEDKLDGESNFLSWKARVTLALKEYDLWDFVEKLVTPPIDPTTLEAHNKKEIKVERVLLDLVKDNLFLTFPRRIHPKRCLMPW